MPKRAYTLPPTTPLVQQVGGHAGVHVTEDESLLLKPALPREIAFYQYARDIDDPSTGVPALRDWMPKFFGLLNLEGKLADPDMGTASAIVPIPQSEIGTSAPSDSLGSGNANDIAHSNLSHQTLVLQNLLYGYRKPCVLDVKLGTILYDEDASEEKKAHMIKKAEKTTSLHTGMRLTGFQVYSNHSPDPIVYGREYGYHLKPEQLQEGIAHFFPYSIPTGQTNDCLDTPSPSDSGVGLPVDILLHLLSSLHRSLAQLRECLWGAEVRIVGGSVLIIYEGDWERAGAVSGRGGGPHEEEEDEADGSESDQIEVEVDEQGEIIIESISGSAFETSSSSSNTDPQPRMYTVSLIDFAHARIVPGSGRDEGVLKGMDNLINLIDGRRKDIAALIERGRERRLGDALELTLVY